MTAITAVIHLGAIEKTGSAPTPLSGQQLAMEGLSGLIYVTPETATQWIGVLQTIANEKSNA